MLILTNYLLLKLPTLSEKIYHNSTNLNFEAWYDVFKHKELVDQCLIVSNTIVRLLKLIVQV